MGRWMEGQKVPQNSQEKMKYKKEKKSYLKKNFYSLIYSPLFFLVSNQTVAHWEEATGHEESRIGKIYIHSTRGCMVSIITKK